MRMPSSINIIRPLIAVSLLFIIMGCKNDSRKDNRIELNINTVPAGASIVFQGKENGLTPFKCKTVPGNYVFKIAKADYQPEWIKVEIQPGPAKTVMLNLKPIMASVLFTSKPDHAKVMLGNEAKGLTPVIIKNLTPGNYQFTVEKPGYAARSVACAVNNDRPQMIEANLETNVGIVNVSSEPRGARLYIDDKPFGVTPYTGELEEGKHKLRLVKDDYSPMETTVAVFRNKNMVKNLVLEKIPGKLQITTVPKGVSVFINGKPYGISPVTAENLPPGEYNILANGPGYDDHEQKATVTAGRITPVDITMTQNTGMIEIVVNPPGASIYLDEKKFGVAEKADGKNFSKIFTIKNIKAGEHTITLAHKRAVPDRKVITVKVAKGSVTRLPPIYMWVANAEIRLKSGEVLTGLLYYENPAYILFGPQPGIKREFQRNELDYVKKIQVRDE